MAISQLSLTDFRNLRSTTLDFNSRFNLISGDNGSGKTSLLEAIYVLCQAHSFRTHQLKQCVTHEKNGFLLFGRFDGYKAGIAKNDKRLENHIDGENVKRRSELVRRTPINPEVTAGKGYDHVTPGQTFARRRDGRCAGRRSAGSCQSYAALPDGKPQALPRQDLGQGHVHPFGKQGIVFDTRANSGKVISA